jgi:predicted transposase/invertase (TIGR01784 family)
MQKSEEIGEARGIEKGKFEEKKEMARLMKKEGEPLEKISKYTQLTIKEIERP